MDLDLGPLVNRKQQQRVWDFLSDAPAGGIEMMAQGEIVDEAPGDGFYQAPVLLRDVPSAHRLWQEEVFGPVLADISIAGIRPLAAPPWAIKKSLLPYLGYFIK
jgi:aldehyde dehydrogenase (NAD+)